MDTDDVVECESAERVMCHNHGKANRWLVTIQTGSRDAGRDYRLHVSRVGSSLGSVASSQPHDLIQAETDSGIASTREPICSSLPFSGKTIRMLTYAN